MRGVSFFRLPVTLLIAMAALFVSAGAQTASAAPQIPCRPGQSCPYWGIMTTQNPGNLQNELRAAAAISTNDVWAAGDKIDIASSRPRPGVRSSRLPSARLSPGARIGRGPKAGCGACTSYALIEHWNGVAWSVASHPASTDSYSVFDGMAALASNDVWAVGGHINTTSGHSEDLIEHWDGATWSRISAGTILQDESLVAVAGKTASDVWAVGYYIDAAHGNIYATEIKHWDGVSWSLVPSPNAMSGGSPIDSQLFSVAALASNDVWAVGYAGLIDSTTLIEHWNGVQWSIVASPNVNGNNDNMLLGVSGSGPNDVWAVGGYAGQAASVSPLIEHWNGSSWSIVSIYPAATVGELDGVIAASLGNVWAVGFQQDSLTLRTG